MRIDGIYMSKEEKGRICCLCGKHIEKDEKTIRLGRDFLKDLSWSGDKFLKGHVDFEDIVFFKDFDRKYMNIVHRRGWYPHKYTCAHYSCVEEIAARWHKRWYISSGTQENPWLRYLPKEFLHKCMPKYIRDNLMCYYCRKYISDKDDEVRVRINRRTRLAHKACFERLHGYITLSKWTNK